MDMARAFLIAILITYMLLAAILENLFQPLLILGTVPLALIGVFAALYLTGQTMNLSSMMAIIMLVGIVVNNAILLLDYTNILKRQGRSTKEALLEACPVKLKPIIMSTSAIVLGMMPLAIGLGAADGHCEHRRASGVHPSDALCYPDCVQPFYTGRAFEKCKPIGTRCTGDETLHEKQRRNDRGAVCGRDVLRFFFDSSGGNTRAHA
jgi:hypothetical protein